MSGSEIHCAKSSSKCSLQSAPGLEEGEDDEGEGDAGAKSAGSCSRSGSSTAMSNAGGGSIAAAPSNMIPSPHARARSQAGRGTRAEECSDERQARRQDSMGTAAATHATSAATAAMAKLRRSSGVGVAHLSSSSPLPAPCQVPPARPFRREPSPCPPQCRTLGASAFRLVPSPRPIGRFWLCLGSAPATVAPSSPF